MKSRQCLFVLIIAMTFSGCNNTKSDFGVFEEQKDIGQCAIPGDLTYDIVRDDYMIEGSGENVWFGSDDFHFAWFRTEGDLMVRSRIEFVGTGHHAHRKTGWMFRSSTDSSAVHVSATIHGDGLTGIQYREATGEDMAEMKSDADGPLFIQFSRTGDTYELITASSTGIVDTVVLRSAAMPEKYFAGIFICSHDNSHEESAIFSNVEIEEPGKENRKNFMQYISENSEQTNVDMAKREEIIAWCIVPFNAGSWLPGSYRDHWAYRR